MFRDCYFTYAGKSSREYNLKLMFINDEHITFSSGGGYSLDTDFIGNSSESVLYTKNYSDNNLQFDVEIVNPDRNISEIEMAEIKQWLFGQSASWQKLQLVTNDLYGNIFFYCQLIPNEDYTDGNGYRALRCQVICNSGYAYKGLQKLQIEKPSLYQYTNNTAQSPWNVDIASGDTLPLIEIQADTSVNTYTNLQGGVMIENITNSTAVFISNAAKCTGSNNTVVITFNCQTGTITCNNSTQPIVYLGTKTYNDHSGSSVVSRNAKCGLLRLDRGVNEFKISGDYSTVKLRYRPTVRVGAF